jgi:hypothetical protein
MLSLVLKLYALMSLVSLVLMVWCLVEAVSTDESRIRHLPKFWWILLILFFPLAGSIAWLAAGRPRTRSSSAGCASGPRRSAVATPSSAASRSSVSRRSGSGADSAGRTRSRRPRPDSSGPPAAGHARAASYRSWMTSVGALLG